MKKNFDWRTDQILDFHVPATFEWSDYDDIHPWLSRTLSEKERPIVFMIRLPENMPMLPNLLLRAERLINKMPDNVVQVIVVTPDPMYHTVLNVLRRAVSRVRDRLTVVYNMSDATHNARLVLKQTLPIAQ